MMSARWPFARAAGGRPVPGRLIWIVAWLLAAWHQSADERSVQYSRRLAIILCCLPYLPYFHATAVKLRPLECDVIRGGMLADYKHHRPTIALAIPTSTVREWSM